jgi:transketolase
VAWQLAIQRQGATCLLFSRQTLPHQERDQQTCDNIRRGAYILVDCSGQPDALIIATGSEVSLAVESAKILAAQGKKIRVISMPSTDVFAQQSKDYQESVLPEQITSRVAVEAGAKDIWYKYVGRQGKIIGLDRYGESAPAAQVYKALGITQEAVVQAVLDLLTADRH